MRARGRRGCPHTPPAAPLHATDPLTSHPAPRLSAPFPELTAPLSGTLRPGPGIQVPLGPQPPASLWPPRGVSKASLRTPSRCRVHAPPGRAAGVLGSYAEAGWRGGRRAAPPSARSRSCPRARAQTCGPRRLPGCGPPKPCLLAAAAAADAAGPRRHVLVVSVTLRVGRVRLWVGEAGGWEEYTTSAPAAQETRLSVPPSETSRQGCH